MQKPIRFVFLIICLLFVGSLPAQDIILQGQILDSATREPLSFATIGVTGSTIGTASNVDGRFVLKIPEEYSDSLFFCSYVGYRTYEKQTGILPDLVTILLQEEKIMLDEVEVKPWSAWDYIKVAVEKIPENYHSEPFYTTSYYSEYLSENNNFLKYTEGVILTYNPPYGDTSKIASRIIQARRHDNLEPLRFMRKKIEKKMKKEEKKAKKRGEEWEGASIDEAILSSTFGGPRMILRHDPVRDTASFLNPQLHHLYEYQIEGYTTYHGQNVIIIQFKSRKKYEHRKRKGNIYIAIDSDAIVAIDFQSRIIIHNAVRPLLFIAGIAITDPQIHATMHYKPYKGRWYINDIAINARVKLTKKKMFAKNEHGLFKLFQSLITTDIEQENVTKIPKEEQLDNWKPLEEQVDEDPEFWKHYQVARPAGFSGN